MRAFISLFFILTSAPCMANQVGSQSTWVWPANGQIISGFAEGGSKGLSIAGAPGEAVFAAETGNVVYSGSGLRGYGNLVIVKHEQDVITAYAHNRAILVKKGQTVRRGQKIAELGNSDADRYMLFFEVRKDGKPVDPLSYLPAREGVKPSLVEGASEPSAQELAVAALKEREARLKAELELARLKLELDKGKDASTNISSEVSATLPLPSTSKENTSKQTQLSNQRLALVIGNDSYKNVPKLENAVGDSKAISSMLAGLGYEVLTFNNLNEKEFKRSLRRFKQRLKGGEEVVFFFAGHGVQIGSANYLLPTDVGSDSEDQIQDEGIPLQRVLDDFSESKVKFSLAMVDACRDNPFKSTGRSIGGRGLAATSAATGQMVIFSAGVGQQALDRLGNNDKASNGLFTRVLIDKVSQSKEPIHILMRDVREEVAELAQSVGHQQVPAIYDQVIGNFYFVPRKLDQN